ncbi:kin of IRRE-like protein 1 isoform X2 [Parasteatoda tepidariorum]|uniref:kin of IRRE-like protein 1 isoform X2 n=1 Tax=Parasteatoda tepidariorum TaxID=114398 RepID=UPI0039BCDCD9
MTTLWLFLHFIIHLNICEILAGIPGIKLRSMNFDDENQQLPEFHSVAGGRAELPCNITHYSSEDKVSLVLWYKEDARAPIYSVDARNSPLEKAKHFPGTTLGSRAYFETFSKPTVLRIEPIQEKDAGIYRCRVDYRWARTFTHSMILKVIVPPKETVILDEENNELSGVIGPYDEGLGLKLRCESIGGIPPPAVTWWRGSTLLDDTFDTLADGVVRNDLVIPILQRSDLLMVITCNSNNNNATVAVATSVKINLNLKPTEARITSLRRTLSAGRRAELECTSAGSRPAARISWWIGTTQLANTTESFSPDRNRTTSLLNFWPTGDHNNKYLGCRAENPMLPGQAAEDGWTLNVSYIPRVKLNIKIDHGKHQSASEGSDVRFLCEITANPWVTDIGFLSEDGRMVNDPDTGIIIDNNTLIIKSVQRKHAGNYQCHGMNSEGTGLSEKVNLKVNYSPICRAGQKIVYGVAKEEPAKIECSVDAEPSEVSFRWNFNNSVEQHDILSFTSSGPTSIATYIPRSLKDFGKLYCWAKNKVGDQQVPCIFNVIPAGPPDQVRNCSVTNYTADSLRIECEEGYDGGLQQKFYLEVYNEAQEYLEKNLTRLEPLFVVQDIQSSTEYLLVVYAGNMKGRSPSVVIRGATEASPRTEQGFASESINIILGVMIGVVAALVFVAGIAVFIIRMREEERESGSGEGPAREKDEILLKKNLVDPSEHDGKDPDVIPPQNAYCAEMEQGGGIPNMLLPPNEYIGPEEHTNYRIEAVQEMTFDQVPQKNPLYESGYTGSLQRNPKHRQEAYIDFCPNQPVVASNLCQYDASAVPFATLDYHRRPPVGMMAGVMPHPEQQEEDGMRNKTLPRGRTAVHNPNFHGNREVYTPPRGRRTTISTPV